MLGVFCVGVAASEPPSDPASAAGADQIEPSRSSGAAARSGEGHSGEDGEAMYHQVLERATDALLLQDHERQQRMLAFVESSHDWFWAMDVDGVLTYSNAGIAQILGLDARKIVGTSKLALVHEDDRRELRESLPQLAAARRGWHDLLLRYRHRDGSQRFLESSGVPIVGVDGAVSGFQGVDRDATERIASEGERKKLELQMRQAQKLEAVGFLAGGVAHDFNNILQVIISTLALARGKCPAESGLRAHLDEIDAAAQSAGVLTRQLLAFGRQQVVQPEYVEPDELIREALGLLRRLLADRVSLRFEPGAAKIGIRADQGQFEQIVTNLCVNARDAMPNGGEVVLTTQVVELDADFCGAHAGIAPGAYLALSVSDSGVGMSPETRERIFEPFFTTKAPGRGMGLGLSTSYGIVRQHHGAIDVSTGLGQGTTFCVYLPVAPAPDEPEDGEREAQSDGAETILVVEDEELVRSLAEEMLTRAGYNVLTAEDGKSALALAQLHRGAIDLVLLDVVLPDATGPELEVSLKDLAPHARVLFTTGYAASERDQRFQLGQEFELLPKPYRHDELLKKVRALLDAK